ncbi:MAG: hypothetical protein IKE43_07045 [Coriobacteriales bacterium]|nr:hypothetical protein [Coriobacteriales bacterium]
MTALDFVYSLQNPELVRALTPQDPVIILTGHYGVGKTNLALNLAYACASEGFSTTLVDLDLVNPYFRSSEYKDQVLRANIRSITPVLANTSLDTPSITGELFAALEVASAHPESQRIIIDVGGDDAGATALGRYREALLAANARLHYLVNAYRSLTQEPEEAAVILREIEAACGLAASGIINVSHLRTESEWEHIEHGFEFAREVRQILGVPIIAHCIPALLRSSEPQGLLGKQDAPCVYIEQLVKTPWE